MAVAFVNPPGKYRYLRDYYCASIAKSNYYYPPIDFVWLSASLSIPLKIFDAINENISQDQVVRSLISFNPSFVFCLISGISLEEDIEFIKEIKKVLNTKIIIIGDICRVVARELLLTYSEIDAVLESFVCINIMTVLSNKFPPENPVPGWVFRFGNTIIKEVEKNETKDFKIGIPKWHLFQLEKYRFPFARRQPVATVLTDYGCPFSCSYCPVGTLKWNLRNLNEVMAEIDFLTKIGIQEIHFRDQTFGVNKNRTISLLKYIRDKKLSWSCFSRIDVVDEGLLIAMKESGCHTVIFGIESGDYDFREKYGKKITDTLLREVLNLCSRLRINTVGTFIVGLPGETKFNIIKTIKLAKSLPLDYASFNIATPRFGSKLNTNCSPAGLIISNSSSQGFMPYEESFKMVKLANKKFYLRPSYILKRFIKLNSLSSLTNEIKTGYNLLLGK